MTQLDWDHFAQAQGRVYRIESPDGTLELTLETVEKLEPSLRDGGSFRLEFRGPGEFVLPQATYRFSGPAGDYDMFIVPVARDSARTVYEATFN